MKMTASERLLARAKQAGAGSTGISGSDIARVPLTADVIGEVGECLSSTDVSELKWGLWFAFGILGSNPPRDFLKWLRPKVPAWLKHEDWNVRDRALNILIRLRANYKNYRELMLEMLADVEPEVRWHALKHYETFLTRDDIPLLLGFQNDDYMSETEMGSPLIYAIRNDALAVIEALCERQFAKKENVETSDADRMVYWWDWQPFVDWWAKSHGRRRFWRRRAG